MHSDPDHDLARIAATQHGVFNIDDARSASLTDIQIRHRTSTRWVRIHNGVYRVAGAPITWRGNLLAATMAGGGGAAISHRAAAALYGLPGGRADLVELTCVRWQRTVESGVVVHESRRLDPRDIQLVDGIPVTRPERVLLDIALYY